MAIFDGGIIITIVYLLLLLLQFMALFVTFATENWRPAESEVTNQWLYFEFPPKYQEFSEE